MGLISFLFFQCKTAFNVTDFISEFEIVSAGFVPGQFGKGMSQIV